MARKSTFVALVLTIGLTLVFGTESRATLPVFDPINYVQNVLNSPIGSTILESCPTKILLPNPDAANPALAAAYRALGLTAKQMEIIAGATPKRHYYYMSPNGRRLFALDLGDAAMSFIGAGGKDDISVVRALISEQGQRWPAERLRSRGLNDAAQNWLQYPNRSSSATPSPPS